MQGEEPDYEQQRDLDRDDRHIGAGHGGQYTRRHDRNRSVDKQTTGAEPATTRIPIGRVLFGVVVVFALAAVGRQLGGYLPRFAEWIDGLGAWGPVLFVVGYAVATVAFVPGSVLTLAAGAIFGLLNGTIYVFVAATIGAALAFLVARHLARGVIEQRLEGNQRFGAIDQAVGREGFKIVVLLRLSPVFPFNLLNYALGLTGVRFHDYLLASIGMVPGTLLYVYYGKVAGDVARLSGGAQVQGAAYYGVLAIGLVATILVTAFVTRTARRALGEATRP